MSKHQKIIDLLRQRVEMLDDPNLKVKAWREGTLSILDKILPKDAREIKSIQSIKITSMAGGFIQTGANTINCIEIGKSVLNSLINTYELELQVASPKENHFDNNKVFIVHGRNNEVKLEVARYVDSLGLKSVILHEQASGSQTVIEKIEKYTDVGFGIVVYTDCDFGGLNSNRNEVHLRARQNVVFEHGYLIGKLGRSRVCAIVKGDIERPNDISGVLYIDMTNSDWKHKIANELKAVGYEVD